MAKSKYRKPLQKSLRKILIYFILCLCIVLSAFIDYTYTRTIYSSYQTQMDDILHLVDATIDDDDLSECARTGIESKEYTGLHDFMDDVDEEFSIHYLYIITPLNTNDIDNVQIILSANKVYERDDDDILLLGDLSGDSYSASDVATMIKIMQGTEIVYFKDRTSWGYDYTAALPLVNSAGEHYGLLCVDIDVTEIQTKVYLFNIINICIIAVLSIIIGLLTHYWISRNITEPIKKLETSVSFFAEKAHNMDEPSQLVYIGPDIHTDNEIEGLSKAVSQMALDMKRYIDGIVDAEKRVSDMKTQVTRMDMLAYQDALTHVKNKAWYDEAKIRVNNDIKNKKATFGIIMADLNNLKVINDNYGHDKGNEYIFGSCHQICEAFEHSPVFRIGGDEFVVLIEGPDYENRLILFEKLINSFSFSSQDENREPWLRYSAAIGMSVFSEGDKSVDDVFARADKLMYENKKESKLNRV